MTHYRKLIVPIDFSEPSRAALARAASLAEALDAPLTLLHSLQAPAILSAIEVGRFSDAWEAVREWSREEFERWRSEAEGAGVPVVPRLTDRDPVDAIAAEIDVEGCLVVMGSHGYRGLRHATLGSVAERTIRSVDAPVLVVREAPEDAAAPPARMLLATDFSDASAAATRCAIELAQDLSARLDVVHAFHVPLVYWYEIPPPVPLAQDLRRRADAMLGEIADEIRAAGLSGAAHRPDGMPSAAIPEVAARLGADLVVMGTRGHSGLGHVLLGSVTERVLRHSEISVLAVRPTAEAS